MNRRVIKIMFVCHGNICRSPMAEMILKHLLRQRGLEGDFFVASSATSTEEIWGGIGNPIYPPARAELMQHGIPIEPHRAVQVQAEDYGAYHYFVGMDSANIRNLKRLFSGDPQGKVFRLLDFAAEGGDVADPWYSDRFDLAFADILRGCEGLLARLLQERRSLEKE